ncbi:uncharacterized protein LOC131936529 isoform X2 [Physella acuta]|uniref:uncharacterized protein LOC131936529 isoform X2 n=1 Tax=Physella acuta TaxID=109671 RepID=UPI0027DE5F22|nr:uncharacterized protein LOC131936529 isoform X2 [Physella acuta]
MKKTLAMKLLTFLAVVVTDILLCQAGEDYEETACLDFKQLLLKQNKVINQMSQKFQKLEAKQRPMTGWTLAFRGTAYIGKSVYDAYTDGTGIPSEVEPGCKQVIDPLPCNNHYRNSEVFDNWGIVEEVAFVVYSNYQKVKEIIFDSTSTTYMNWFDKSKVKFSTWTRIKTDATNFFRILGDNQLSRRFFINRVYSFSGCPEDRGWFVVVDKVETGACKWEKADKLPVFKYSRPDGPENWNTGDVANADMFAIFVKFHDTP